jgi:RHS repeat-associated protein
MVIGIDIHLVNIPPAVGVPIPHPHVSMVFDVFDLLPPVKIPVPRQAIEVISSVTETIAPLTENVLGPGQSSGAHKMEQAVEQAEEEQEAPQPPPDPFIMMPLGFGSTVKMNKMVRSQVGTKSKVIPCHIPLGAGFTAPPRINHKGSSFLGSMTVLVEGMPCTYAGLPFMTCSCIGVPEIIRVLTGKRAAAPKKPKEPGITFLPTSFIMPIPLGSPVNIGGPPIPMLSVLDMLGPLMKGLKFLKKRQKKSAFWKNMSARLHKKFGVKKGSFMSKAICFVTGHPVDVCDGKFFTDWVDIELPGPIPFRWERTYYSVTSNQNGPLGYGWHHNYDRYIRPVDHETFAYHDGEGRDIMIPLLLPGLKYFDRNEKIFIHCDETGSYYIKDNEGLTWKYAGLKEGDKTLRLTSISDPADNHICFRYNRNKQLHEIIDSSGNAISVRYNDEGNIESLWLPHPDNPGETIAVARYEYDVAGNCCLVSDALDQPMHFEYHGHLMTRETWRNGLSFYFEYDKNDHTARCTHTWGDGGIYNHRLDYQPGLTIVTNSLGNQTHYFHKNGMPYRIVDANGGETFYVYEENMLVTGETDAVGNTTHYTYDEMGNKTGIIEPTGAVTSIQYNEEGLPLIAISPAGAIYTWKYNTRGQLSKRSVPGLQVEYTYGKLHQLIQVKENGISTDLLYDLRGNIVRTQNQDNLSQHFTYNQWNYLVNSIDANGNVTRYKYDLLNRLIELQEADGNVRKLLYDAQDNVVFAKDRYYEVKFGYTGMSKMAYREQNGHRVQFEYNTEEDLLAIANEHNEVYRFSIDRAGNVKTETGFDGLLRKYTRDRAGRVILVERPAEKFTAYQYDVGGRITDVKYSDGTKEKYTYRQDGSLLAAINEDATVQFKRDEAGRVTSEIQNGIAVNSKYDFYGNRLQVTSSLGANITVKYNGYGEVEKMAAGNWQATWQRDQFGQEIARNLPGGIQSRWQRDKLGRPVAHQVTGHNNSIRRFKKYDWGIDDRLQNITDPLKYQSLQFRYDKTGTLISSLNESGLHTGRFADAVGNLYEDRQMASRRYSKGGRLEETTLHKYYYDAEGNLARKVEKASCKSFIFDWHENGMLRKVTRPDGKVVNFRYDALGRRIEKEFAGIKTKWVWDGNTPLHEWKVDASKGLCVIDSEGQLQVAEEDLVTWLFEEDSFVPTAKLQNGNNFSIVTDYLGTPAEMYNEAGQRVWEGVQDIYGRSNAIVGKKSDCPFRFQGQYEDVETGLYYNRFRYYSVEEGMYISQDPINLSSGQPNLYSYVNNPTQLVDIYGLIKENCVYVLKQSDKIVYVGIGNGDERFQNHKIEKTNKFDRMEVIAECTSRRKARNIEGSLLNKAGNEKSELYNPNLLNATRKDSKYYHSYTDKPKSPRKLLSDKELKKLLQKKPIKTKTADCKKK